MTSRSRSRALILILVSGLIGSMPARAPAQELAATVAPAADYCSQLRTAISLRADLRQRRRAEAAAMGSSAMDAELKKQLRVAYPSATTSGIDSIFGRLAKDSMVVSVFGNGNVRRRSR
jgi:hypothetical protein